MNTSYIIRLLALLALLVVGAMSVIGSMQQIPDAPVEMRLAPLFGTVIWIFLAWKIWTRPAKWGPGVAIFLLLMTALQSYLWFEMVNSPSFDAQNHNDSLAVFILRDELPILIAAILCMMLRFYHPNTGKAAKGQGRLQ